MKNNVITQALPTVAILLQDPLNGKIAAQWLAGAGISAQVYISATKLLNDIEVVMPSCVLCDFYLEEMSGLQVIKALRRRHAYIPVIFTSVREETDLIAAAFNLGAHKFIKRPYQQLRFLESIQSGLRLNSRQQQFYSKATNYRKKLLTLTDQEQKIVQLCASNQTAPAIGKILGLSHRTVESHRNRALQKLGLNNFPELIQVAAYSDVLASFEDII